MYAGSTEKYLQQMIWYVLTIGTYNVSADLLQPASNSASEYNESFYRYETINSLYTIAYHIFLSILASNKVESIFNCFIAIFIYLFIHLHRLVVESWLFSNTVERSTKRPAMKVKIQKPHDDFVQST